MKVRTARARCSARLGYRLAVLHARTEIRTVRGWLELAKFAEDEREVARLSSGLDMLRQRARHLIGRSA